MQRTLTNRLIALEQQRPAGDGGRVFIAYIDDDPPRYFVDGQVVSVGAWHGRAQMAGVSSYVIEVGHTEMEYPCDERAGDDWEIGAGVGRAGRRSVVGCGEEHPTPLKQGIYRHK